MDDYLFEDMLSLSKYLPEANSYLEILNYSDESFNTRDQHPLEDSEVQNFIHRRGAFSPKQLPDGVSLTSGLRLILQVDAKQKSTFAPSTISLPVPIYREMVQTFNLSYRWIESSAAVGPLFWACYDQDEESPHLQVIYRKSDVVKKGQTRGWELAFSHDMKSGITSGFLKGTASSDVKPVLKHLHRCAGQIGHAMVLPMIIFGHDMGINLEVKQRNLRQESRRLENAISLRGDIKPDEGFVINGIVDYDIINQYIIEVHTQVLWKNPTAYQAILTGFKTAFAEFHKNLPLERMDSSMLKMHDSMLSRISFYNTRLEGIKEYVDTTMKRLELQRHALEMNTSRRENKLNLQIAFQQRQLIHTTKRETEGQKTIATLGIIFLPPTVISGIFSTTFFNFAANDPDGTRVVSTYFWIFWALTIPITAMIFLVFLGYTKYRQSQYAKEDKEIEGTVDELETKIQKEMRVRTIERMDTFSTKDEAAAEAIGGMGSLGGRGRVSREGRGGVIAAAIAGSGREGASLIGMNSLKSTKSNKTEPKQKIYGEATLDPRSGGLELRPSGRLSVHSRSPSRDRRERTPEPGARKMLGGEAIDGSSDGSALKEGLSDKETSKKQNNIRKRRSGIPSIEGGDEKAEASDDEATQGVNGRRFGLNWLAGHMRRIGRGPDEEQGDSAGKGNDGGGGGGVHFGNFKTG